MIQLGFKMALPYGYEAQLRPRSSMGKEGIIIPNSPATIDAGYRGEVCVLLCNTRMFLFDIEPGMKIAQMVIQKVPEVATQVVSEADLPPSERGEGKLGSSGKYARHTQEASL